MHSTLDMDIPPSVGLSPIPALPVDILEEIFLHFDVESDSSARGPLLRALLSSKVIHRVALRRLWRYLSSPLPLVRLLPFVKMDDRGRLCGLDNTSTPKELDWSSFDTHASLVYKLDYITVHPLYPHPSSFSSFSAATTPTSYWTLFAQLLTLRPSSPASSHYHPFPRLKEFKLLFRSVPTRNEMRVMTKLFASSPSMERLELHSINDAHSFSDDDEGLDRVENIGVRSYRIGEFVKEITRKKAKNLKRVWVDNECEDEGLMSKTWTGLGNQTSVSTSTLRYLVLPRPMSQSSLHTFSNLASSLEELTLVWPRTELSSEEEEEVTLWGNHQDDEDWEEDENNEDDDINVDHHARGRDSDLDSRNFSSSPFYPLDPLAFQQLGALINLTKLDIDFSDVTGVNYPHQSFVEHTTSSFYSYFDPHLSTSKSTSTSSSSSSTLTSSGPLPALTCLKLKAYLPLVVRFLEWVQSPGMEELEIVTVLGELKDWERVFGVVGGQWGDVGSVGGGGGGGGRLKAIRCTDLHRSGEGIEYRPVSSLSSSASSMGLHEEERRCYTLLDLFQPLLVSSSGGGGSGLKKSLRVLMCRGFKFVEGGDEGVCRVLEGLEGLEEVGMPVPMPLPMHSVGGTGVGTGVVRASDARVDVNVARRNSKMRRPGWETLLAIGQGKVGRKLRKLEMALDTETFPREFLGVGGGAGGGEDIEMSGPAGGRRGRFLPGRVPVMIGGASSVGGVAGGGVSPRRQGGRKSFMWGCDWATGYECLDPYAWLDGGRSVGNGRGREWGMRSSMRSSTTRRGQGSMVTTAPASGPGPGPGPTPVPGWSASNNLSSSHPPSPLSSLIVVGVSEVIGDEKVIARWLDHLFPELKVVEMGSGINSGGGGGGFGDARRGARHGGPGWGRRVTHGYGYGGFGDRYREQWDRVWEYVCYWKEKGA